RLSGLVEFFLPDRRHLLERLDRVTAAFERLRPMGRGDRDDDARVADLERTGPVGDVDGAHEERDGAAVVAADRGVGVVDRQRLGRNLEHHPPPTGWIRETTSPYFK